MNSTSYESFASVVQATVDNSIYQKWNAATQEGTFQALTNVGTNKALQIGDTNPAIK